MLFSEGEAEWGLGNPPSAVARMGQEKGPWEDPYPPWEYAAQKCAREDIRFSLMCSSSRRVFVSLPGGIRWGTGQALGHLGHLWGLLQTHLPFDLGSPRMAA